MRPRPAPPPPAPPPTHTATAYSPVPVAADFHPASNTAPDAAFFFIAITIPALVAAVTSMFHHAGGIGRRS